MKKLFEKSGGFSLVELCIVLMISGLIMVPIYNSLFQTSRVKHTEDKMELIRSALAEHVRIYGRYPCPARMNATRANADYATNNDYVNGTCTNIPPGMAIPGFAADQVYVGALPILDLQGAMDCRDFNVAAPNANRPVGLPNFLYTTFRKSMLKIDDIIANAVSENTSLDRTRCITMEEIVDEHGGKFLYAVSRQATIFGGANPDPLNPNTAQIRVIDQNGVAATAQNLHYVIVSFGKDLKGATQGNGTAFGIACGNDALSPENENCDGDAVFRMMPHNSVLADNGTSYDDAVDFSITGSSRENDMWNWGASNFGGANNWNLYFNQLARSQLIIDQMRTGGPLGPATLGVNDLVNINHGLIDPVNPNQFDLRVERAGGVGGSLLLEDQSGANGSDVFATRDVNSTLEVRAGTAAPGAPNAAVISPQYCYDLACDGL